MTWDEAIGRERAHDCVPVESNHPMYLLYTSGTTGTPKAVVRPTGGHAVRLHWSMDAIYDVDPGEVKTQFPFQVKIYCCRKILLSKYILVCQTRRPVFITVVFNAVTNHACV